MFEAKVIKDSICNGQRLTTMQVTHPRIVHAEFNTHCMFAGNASSSRAIPFAVTVKRIQEDPFIPIYWGENQSGMQAAKEITDWKKEKAIKLWLAARDNAIHIASQLASKTCINCGGTGKDGIFGDCIDCYGTGEGINIHKQIANRLTETWAWITVCVTGDSGAWSNYFALRCHPDAQPEIQRQAYMAQKEYFENTPDSLKIDDWHLPYLDKSLVPTFAHDEDYVKISVGRCARTSYLTQEGTHDPQADIALHNRLVDHTPLHASPLEHVCVAKGDGERYGKYKGWKAYRHMLPREYVTDFKPNYKEYFEG